MSIQQHTITILMLAYNAEKTIIQAIDGALAQTVPCEIIISDDASPDDTFELAVSRCSNYSGHHHVSVIRNEINMGVTAHLNCLFKLASGKIIMLMAGDDISYQYRALETIKNFDANPDVYVLGSTCDEIDMHGRPLGFATRALPHKFDLSYFANAEKMIALLGATMAFRRELLDRFGPLHGLVEDNVLTLRGALLGRGICLPSALIQYRQNPKSLSNWLLARGDNCPQAFRNRYERTSTMYLAVADDLESCLEKGSFSFDKIVTAKSIVNMYRLESETRFAILNRPRTEWIGLILRGFMQRGQKRKSLERMIKLIIPKKWFGLYPSS